MRVLVLAPHPFFQERGTPIAVDLLLRVLSERGDEVDVVTFHLGADRSYPGVRVWRTPRLPGIRRIRPGFSAKKLLCDAFLMVKAASLVRRTHYDVIHGVEESIFMALALARGGTRTVYDMDSSMPDQMVEKKRWLRPLLPLMKRCERFAVRRADAVAAVCDALAESAQRQGARYVELVRDVSLLPLTEADDEPNSPDEDAEPGVTIMYIGNLEAYQGIGLLIESFALLKSDPTPARLVIVGGEPGDIRTYEHQARRLGVASHVRFTGPLPLNRMGALFAQADILVSPRTQGHNTPMKIYSYLDSGRPILATRLPTHTQVLDEEVAVLEPPEPAAFADGMRQLINDPERRRELAARAKKLAKETYSFPVYRAAVRRLYERLEQTGDDTGPPDPAL